MIFETLGSADSFKTSSMRMIECPGLQNTTADMHLGPNRAHLTLDSTPGQTRFLRRLDFSNSLLVTAIEHQQQAQEQEQKPIEDDSAVSVLAPPLSSTSPSKSGGGDVSSSSNSLIKATALQRCKGLFETDPIRPPTEILEAVLRPSCITLDELDGVKRFPKEKLIKLSALYDVSFMSKKALIRYLVGRAALFTKCGDGNGDDYLIRLLDPSLLREAVIEIASFLTTTESHFYNAMKFESPSGSRRQKNNEDEATEETKPQEEEQQAEDKVLEAHRLESQVQQHFSSSQFPVIYDIAWKYMTSFSHLEEEELITKRTFNLKRIVPLLATHLVSKPGALTKQSLAELWESCTSEYWFLKQEPYYSSSLHRGEAYLYGFFAETELKGVVAAPHTKMPLQLVPRIVTLFKMSSKWEKEQLLAYLSPIADSPKVLSKMIGTRCREVKDDGKVFYYLV